MARGRSSVFTDALAMIRVRRRWWFVPFLLVLLGLGMVVVTAQGSVIAPFIYTLF